MKMTPKKKTTPKKGSKCMTIGSCARSLTGARLGSLVSCQNIEVYNQRSLGLAWAHLDSLGVTQVNMHLISFIRSRHIVLDFLAKNPEHLCLYLVLAR